MRRAFNAPSPPKPPHTIKTDAPGPPKGIRERVRKLLGRDPIPGAGSRREPTKPKTETENQTPEGQEQLAKQKPEDPNSQHSPEGKERTKKSFMDKVKTGALGGLALLPFAILLAATVQGLVDCDNIDNFQPKITAIKSAAWPEYPDWWPDWAPQPQSGTHKVWLTYDPGVHLLTTDTIIVTASNAAGTVETSISGSHSVLNNDDDTVTQIEIAGKYDTVEIDFSNVTASFEINTSCEDRIAYAAGKDLKEISEMGSNVFSEFFGGIPWKTILLVIVFIAVAYLAFQGVSILRS
jgi:hypothetical protein